MKSMASARPCGARSNRTNFHVSQILDTVIIAMPPTTFACSVFKIPLLKGSPGCIVVLGLGLCIALYIYLMYREVQTLDARVEQMCGQLAVLHTGTNERMDELHKRMQHVEAMGMCNIDTGFLSAQSVGMDSDSLPLFIESMSAALQRSNHPGVGGAGSGMTAVVEVEDEQGEDDSVDSDEIKEMLLAQDDEEHGQEQGDHCVQHALSDVEEVAEVENDDEDEEDVVVSHVAEAVAAEAVAADAVAAEAVAAEAVAAEAVATEAVAAEAQSVQRQEEETPGMGVDLRALKVDELRQMLRVRGLDWRGTKEVLIERLETLQ
jgi:hypothetical protein